MLCHCAIIFRPVATHLAAKISYLILLQNEMITSLYIFSLPPLFLAALSLLKNANKY